MYFIIWIFFQMPYLPNPIGTRTYNPRTRRSCCLKKNKLTRPCYCNVFVTYVVYEA